MQRAFTGLASANSSSSACSIVFTGLALAPSSIERALTAIRSMHKTADMVAPGTSGARKVLAGRREELAL
ncbi:hypothetical protein ACFQ08_38650, partial [Streptosporangium algeriense]